MPSAVPSPDSPVLKHDGLIKDLTAGGPVEVSTSCPPETQHPWSAETCRKAAYVSIGLWKIRTIHLARNRWWDRLRAATTPEERLTCERMINAFGEALGLHQHELGAAISAKNPYLDAELRDCAEDRERRAVEKWR